MIASILLVTPLLVSLQGNATDGVAVGKSVVADLPARVEGEQDRAPVTIPFECEGPGPWTLVAGSPDFVPRLSVGGEGTARVSQNATLSGFSVAWLVIAGPVPEKFVSIGAEDDRGGECYLILRAGDASLRSDRAGQMRALIEASRVLADRSVRRGDRARSATLRDKAARAALALGDGASARALAEGQKQDAEEGALAEQSVRARINLGGAILLLGDLEQAEKALADVAPEAEGILTGLEGQSTEPEWVALVCYVHDRLGNLRDTLHGPRAALDAYRRAAELAARSPRNDAEAIAYTALATALDEAGEPADADETIAKALAAVEKPGIRSRVLAGVLSAHAVLLLGRGESARAREECRRALAIEPPRDVHIALLGTIAGTWIEEGRYERAEAALGELALRAEEFGITQYAIPTLLQRAKLAIRLGDDPGALEHLEEALRLQEASGSRRHRIEILADSAIALVAAGNTDEALARYDRAIEACQASGNVALEALVRVDMASLLARTNQCRLALDNAVRAERLAAEAGDDVIRVVALAAQGFLHHELGNTVEARTLTTGAAERLAKLGATEPAIDAQETLARIGLAAGDVSTVESALRAAEDLFAHLDSEPLDRFNRIGLRSRFAGRDPSESNWGAIVQDLAARKWTAASTDEERGRAAADGWRSAQRWKARTLLDRMGRNVDPEQATPRPRREDFQLPSVKSDAVVVEYVAGREHLFAYVSTAGATRLVDLGKRAPIETAARDFVSSIADGSASARNLGETSFSLYERIILPLLAGLPPDAKYWTLVPTADLATIPFEALVTSPPPTEQGDVGFEDLHYLIDSKEIAYAPSSAVLAQLEGRPARSGPRRFLVLGDPVYRTELESNASLASTGTPSRSWIDLDRLPATHDETREIAQLMILSDPKATDEERKRLLELAYRRSGTLTSRLFDLRLGSDAVVSALPSDASSFTNLHFAAHGHVDARDSRHSGLVLSWEPATGGLLALEDLLTVRLDADLVVLSACDTASGPIVRGEGVQSLANAFVEAGARSVIASLWKVADQDAAEIMKAFYRSHLDRGEVPSVALRLAKLEYRKSHQLRGERPTRGPGAIAAHPCSWAAFVFVGAQAR